MEWSQQWTHSYLVLSLYSFYPVLLISSARLRYVKSLPTNTVSPPHIKIKTIKSYKIGVRKSNSWFFLRWLQFLKISFFPHTICSVLLFWCHQHMPVWLSGGTVTFTQCPEIEKFLGGCVLWFPALASLTQRRPVLVWPGNCTCFRRCYMNALITANYE